ncbi:MAG: hypothetical protein CO113_00515 [Elusimicrobia bacterium CG_4_9_14_3_um_filter_62_55]|nr:MAG: hypothetical protein COR54_17050 [Elusimicrobia bacterium CG22_combo_CG10-13_8_21_14_all_63_91]PJA15377.1 MAG: hypothetical protein COX66_10685 [Elusimicrobia bacterium CG_4_10_14_0_2_um_filter_63_34]PJB26938.1 MAG: hypothetical protein CO113_00515 [Elusimicrobia bacterium CG_4_9_14_3_um_filter_62_55]
MRELLRVWKDRRGRQHEGMIVVAIIGILAAIAMPKFAELIRKSNEGATKGNLGAVRSALSIFYGDTRGVYPAHPALLTLEGRYLAELPKAKTPQYHPDSNAVVLGLGKSDLNDQGGWLFIADPADEDYGTMFVNCTHTDSKGVRWFAY